MPRRAACAVLLLLAASPLAAQNLVTNANFDTDDSGWLDPSASDGSFVHDPTLDVNGSPASGSGLLTNIITAVAFGTVTAQQCIPVTAGLAYYWGGNVHFPVNETTTGQTFTTTNFRDGANCTGNLTGAQAATLRNPSTDARGVWHTSNFGSIAAGFTAPPGSVSVTVFLLLTKTEMAGTRSANFDGIFFAQVGTVPVELMEFKVE